MSYTRSFFIYRRATTGVKISRVLQSRAVLQAEREYCHFAGKRINEITPLMHTIDETLRRNYIRRYDFYDGGQYEVISLRRVYSNFSIRCKKWSLPMAEKKLKD